MGTRQFVVFTINGEEFGMNIENISSIEKMLDIFKIPNTPDYIEGLANLRGKVLTIFNLRRRFNLASPEFDENTKIIIASTSVSEIGIIVDGVREIIKVEDNEFDPVPQALNNVRDRFLSGTAKVGGRLILMLDLEKVLTEEDMKLAKKAK